MSRHTSRPKELLLLASPVCNSATPAAFFVECQVPTIRASLERERVRLERDGIADRSQYAALQGPPAASWLRRPIARRRAAGSADPARTGSSGSGHMTDRRCAVIRPLAWVGNLCTTPLHRSRVAGKGKRRRAEGPGGTQHPHACSPRRPAAASR
jgi:hypothetical protein